MVETTEPEARVRFTWGGLQQRSWCEELPLSPSPQVLAPSPTLMCVASWPRCVFLVHLSLPSQRYGGGNILASGESSKPSERDTELGLTLETARADR